MTVAVPDPVDPQPTDEPESLRWLADFDCDDDERGTVVHFVTAPEDGFDW